MVLNGIKALGLTGKAGPHSLSSDHRLPTSSLLKLVETNGENNPTFMCWDFPFKMWHNFNKPPATFYHSVS
jgi:hypothetical protein